VKKFGRSGQTKYTHLLDQDTTRVGSTWGDSERDRKVGFIQFGDNRWAHQLGGTGSIDEAGRRKAQAKKAT
jgi:hypothetical protein